MRRFPSLLVVFVLSAALPLGAAAAGALPPGKIAAVQKAGAEFKTMGAPARETGKPPRESEPRVKALLDTVFDLRVVQAAEPLAFSELDNVFEWNTAIFEAGKVYYLAGTRVTDFKDFTQVQNDPAFLQQVDRNTVAFAPEMGRYTDALLGITQSMLALVNAHLAANPGDREKPNLKAGLPGIFRSAARTLVSAITTLSTSGLTDEWRRARLPAMHSLAPHVARVVGSEVAKALHDRTLQVAQGSADPAVAEGLRKVAANFAR